MRSFVSKTAWFSAGVLVVLASIQTTVYATIVPVPEVDGSTAATALGLITAGVLILRARWSRRK